MAARSRFKPVNINVHPDFHKKLDMERLRFRRNTGLDITFTKMTEILSRSNIRLPPARFLEINGKAKKR